ncbi:hypothetical protein LIER_36821 [Lithospermum erythrorhizon]|uniref:Uncharacterized protein n=1 Tax=Lithospermum erythrorhizon TaxID=34254 RepID=A0AAV3PFG6_LITER
MCQFDSGFTTFPTPKTLYPKPAGSKKRHHPYLKGDQSSSQNKKALLSKIGLEDASKKLQRLRLLGSIAGHHEYAKLELSGFGSPQAVRSLTGLVTSKKHILVFMIETKLWKQEWDHIKKKLRMPNALLVYTSPSVPI